EVRRSGARADCILERVNDAARIVTEEFGGQHGVIRPASRATTCNEQFRYLADRFLAQRDQIEWLAPGSGLLGSASGHHVADHRWQHSRRVLPADQIEAFERLVDKIKRVPGVRIRALGYGREQGVREHSLRDAGGYRGEHRTLGCFAMAHARPTL